MRVRMVKTVVLAVFCLAVVVLAGGGVGQGVFGVLPAVADVTVYRALARKNTTYAKVKDSEFRIDDDGLSTFEGNEFVVTNKQCKLEFTVEGVDSKPETGTSGNIEGMEGYKGTYTPEFGEGHWSLANSDGTVAGDFTAYALTGGKISVNGGYTGGSQSACETPDEPN